MYALLVLLLAGLTVPTGAWCGSKKLPADIDSGLGYLYEFADPQTTTPFEVSRLDKLMAFIMVPKADGISSAARSGAFLDPLAFHQFTVKRSLPFILEYAHSPDIPPQVLTLGTVRYAKWQEFDPRYPDQPDVAKRIQSLEKPLVIRGLENEEIAPDASSGAYYRYDLRRTLVGFRQGTQTVWLSMSRQIDPSDVGHKGYVMDEKNAWHFIYSDEVGIDKFGLGWVESFMYEGFSCNFFVQSDDKPDQVTVAIFKWLRAGWNDMNFVKYKHIRDGLEHYGSILRHILENPNLPPPAEIQAAQAQIAKLSEESLRQMNRDYLLALEKKYGKKGAFPRSWFKKHVTKGNYVDQLTRPQLEATVFLEYMNGALGKHPVTKHDVLLGNLQLQAP